MNITGRAYGELEEDTRMKWNDSTSVTMKKKRKQIEIIRELKNNKCRLLCCDHSVRNYFVTIIRERDG